MFRFAGVDLFLHWSWFLVAVIEINGRSRSYSSVTWNALEYLALFLIVMLHEFGHALACRQVGGTANQIVSLLCRPVWGDEVLRLWSDAAHQRVDGSRARSLAILIGGAVTERPDLFGPALDNVGMSDDLRAELQVNGPANIPDFGTVKNDEDFTTCRQSAPIIA
jgi:hypothetical protein